MRGQNILITGGAGFLGRAIIRQSIREGWGSRFTIISRDETKQDELMRKYGKDADIRCYLGDVCHDVERLADLMRGHQLVIHAAAVKYIPEAERNRWECNRVNVHGSENVAIAAKIAGVDVVIGVSTDKAVEPVNTYGLTKSLMENLYQEANRWGGPAFICARYGNVVGSTGSVIPKFLQSIQTEGQLRITDPRMTRFWLSPDDAVDLLERCYVAAVQEQLDGTTIVDACPSMTIDNLARACIITSERYLEDVAIETIGIRPGEKLSEALLGEAEAATRACHYGHGYVIFPPEDFRRGGLTAGHPLDVASQPYRSDQPDEWVSVPQMVDWIKDAETI